MSVSASAPSYLYYKMSRGALKTQQRNKQTLKIHYTNKQINIQGKQEFHLFAEWVGLVEHCEPFLEQHLSDRLSQEYAQLKL